MRNDNNEKNIETVRKGKLKIETDKRQPKIQERMKSLRGKENDTQTDIISQ